MTVQLCAQYSEFTNSVVVFHNCNPHCVDVVNAVVVTATVAVIIVVVVSVVIKLVAGNVVKPSPVG